MVACTVLKRTVNIAVRSLPKATFAKCMLSEARSLARSQVANELIENWDSEGYALHPGETLKKEENFFTKICRNDGSCKVTGC